MDARGEEAGEEITRVASSPQKMSLDQPVPTPDLLSMTYYITSKMKPLSFMKAPHPLAPLLLLFTLVTGCVIFPHGELVAPPAHGRVVDAETLEPLPNAKVVRRIERLNRSQVAFTDAQGGFGFKQDKDLRWLFAVDEVADEFSYSIEVAGYRPFQTNRYGGGVFYPPKAVHEGRSHSPPKRHDFGLVLLHRQPREIEDRPANGSPRFRSETNSTPTAAGSRR